MNIIFISDINTISNNDDINGYNNLDKVLECEDDIACYKEKEISRFSSEISRNN